MSRWRTAATTAVLSGLLAMGAQAGLRPVAAAATATKTFDLQAHRGGLGLRTENTLASFGNALQLGVSTLELDVQIAADGYAVVTHDRRTNPVKCRDTAPVSPGDPAYPYVGKFIKDLTLAQVRTIECGYQQLPGFPEQENVPGSRMPLLGEVFDLVKRYNADGVMLNIETKVEAGAPHDSSRSHWRRSGPRGSAGRSPSRASTGVLSCGSARSLPRYPSWR